MALCQGSDCAKDHWRDHERLVTSLTEHRVDILAVRCLGICEGPVAVVGAAGHQPVVIAEVRKAKHRDALAASAHGAALSKGLRRRRVSGKKLAKALHKAAKAGLS